MRSARSCRRSACSSSCSGSSRPTRNPCSWRPAGRRRRVPPVVLLLHPRPRAGGQGAAAVHRAVPEPNLEPRTGHAEHPVAAAHGRSFTVSVFLQTVRRYNAIETGVIFTAATLGVLASSLAAERLAKRRPQRTLIMAGFVVTGGRASVCCSRSSRPRHASCVRARPAPDRTRPRRHAHALGQPRAIELPRAAAGRDLGTVAQRLQPRLVVRHCDRRHDPRSPTSRRATRRTSSRWSSSRCSRSSASPRRPDFQPRLGTTTARQRQPG